VTKDLASYHGYWQQDIYQVNEHFGTPGDLKALSEALHRRDMVRLHLKPNSRLTADLLKYLMLDVVVNHFAWAGNGTTVDYSVFNPFNDQKYFHEYQLLSDLDPSNTTDAEIVSFLSELSVWSLTGYTGLAWRYHSLITRCQDRGSPSCANVLRLD
jgi:alpha-amylase